VLTIGNHKGGVGKTTTAVTLGHGLALQGARVLIIDCDPQGQVATFMGLRQESGLFDLLVAHRPLADVTRSATTREQTRPNLYIVPGDKRTATAQVVLTAEGFRLDCIVNALNGIKPDYVVIDTSPSVGALQEAAIHAADWLIIPTAVDYPSAEGMGGILATMKAVNQRGAACKLFGVLPTMFDDVTRESRATMDQLRRRFGDAVLQPIHRATVLRECAAYGVTIWEHDPKSRAAAEYASLVGEVLKRA